MQDGCHYFRDVGIAVVEGDQDGSIPRVLELLQRNRAKATTGQVGHLQFELRRRHEKMPLVDVASLERFHDRVIEQSYAGRWLSASTRVSVTSSKARRARPCEVNLRAASIRRATNWRSSVVRAQSMARTNSSGEACTRRSPNTSSSDIRVLTMGRPSAR